MLRRAVLVRCHVVSLGKVDGHDEYEQTGRSLSHILASEGTRLRGFYRGTDETRAKFART